MNLHLVIGTPMYGGMCTSEYTQSLLNLSESANKSDVKLTTIFLGNESLIQRGRNTVAHHFMNLPDATHLLFIDADIKFRTEDIVRMIQADKSLIIGPVGLKGYNWDEIRQAAINGEDDILVDLRNCSLRTNWRTTLCQPCMFETGQNIA